MDLRAPRLRLTHSMPNFAHVFANVIESEEESAMRRAENMDMAAATNGGPVEAGHQAPRPLRFHRQRTPPADPRCMSVLRRFRGSPPLAALASPWGAGGGGGGDAAITSEWQLHDRQSANTASNSHATPFQLVSDEASKATWLSLPPPSCTPRSPMMSLEEAMQ